MKIKPKIARRSSNAKKRPVSGRKESVRKPALPLSDRFIADPKNKHFFINLRHLVTSLSVGGKVQAYVTVAADLSRLAGLTNGRVWTGNYVSCVLSGALPPSKKFQRVFALYLQKVNRNKKQWFYFAHHHSVAAVFDKSIRAEIIRTHMQSMGYKSVSFSRYAEVKKNSTSKK
jgi:hypothetical protein